MTYSSVLIQIFFECVIFKGVGAPTPDQQEMDEALVKAATIYTDSYLSANAEAGEFMVFYETLQPVTSMH